MRNRIRKHLLVFAAAAPIMALVTYFGLSQVIIQQCYIVLRVDKPPEESSVLKKMRHKLQQRINFLQRIISSKVKY